MQSFPAVALILASIFFGLAAFELLPLAVPRLRSAVPFWPRPEAKDQIYPDTSATEKRFVFFPFTHFLFGVAFVSYGIIALTVEFQGWTEALSLPGWRSRFWFVIPVVHIAMIMSALGNDGIFGKRERR